MQKIDRRSVLKAGALGAAGVAAGALGLEAVIPAAAEGLTTTGSGLPIPQKSGEFTRLPSILTPPTPGTMYTEIGGITAFKPRFSASGFTQQFPGIRPTAAADYFVGSLPLPPNATLTEFVYTFLLNDVNGVNLQVDFITAGVETIVYFATYTTQSTAFQSVALAFPPTQIPVDSFLIPYFGFNSFASTQTLLSARAGYINEPGLKTFLNPRRCYGNGTTTPAEAFILNIDATLKSTTGGGPTGVPAGAKAAFCAVQAYQPGVMTLYPAGSPDTGTANWSVQGTSGQLQMLYMLVPLDSTGKFNIHNRFTDKQIYVDVWGYLIAP